MAGDMGGHAYILLETTGIELIKKIHCQSKLLIAESFIIPTFNFRLKVKTHPQSSVFIDLSSVTFLLPIFESFINFASTSIFNNPNRGNLMMSKNENYNHPKLGDKTRVDPITDLRDIKTIKKMLQDNPRDLCLFVLESN